MGTKGFNYGKHKKRGETWDVLSVVCKTYHMLMQPMKICRRQMATYNIKMYPMETQRIQQTQKHSYFFLNIKIISLLKQLSGFNR